MKKTLYLILFMLIPAIYMAAETTDAFVARVVRKIETAPSIKAEFTVQSSQGRVTGEITVSGDRFVVKSAEGSTWYDGKELWTLSEQTKEVNLSVPTREELAEINPFIFLTRLQKFYTAKTGVNNNKIKVVTFTLKRGVNYNIGNATVTFDAVTLMPKAIAMTVDDSPMTVAVKSCTVGNEISPAYFRYSASSHPGFTIIDLR